MRLEYFKDNTQIKFSQKSFLNGCFLSSNLAASFEVLLSERIKLDFQNLSEDYNFFNLQIERKNLKTVQ